MLPLWRCTFVVAVMSVSMVIRYTLRTCANDKIFNIEFLLNHSGKKPGRSPIKCESCWPPLVIARNVLGLLRILCRRLLSQNAEHVEYISNNISLPLTFPCLNRCLTLSYCRKWNFMIKNSSSLSFWMMSSIVPMFKSSSDMFVEFRFRFTISSSESWDIS